MLNIMDHKIKLLLIAVGVGALFLVGVLAYIWLNRSSEQIGLNKPLESSSFATTQQNSPSPDGHIYRNDVYGYELHYRDPIMVEPSSGGSVFVGPIDQKPSRYRSISTMGRHEVVVATSTFLTLEELAANLEKQGQKVVRSKIGSLPVLLVDDSSSKTYFFLSHEFEYSVIEAQVPDVYAAAQLISDLRFFTKYSNEEIVGIIKEAASGKTYRNEHFGFSIAYPGSYTPEVMHERNDSFEMRFYELMGYEGANVHIKVTPIPAGYAPSDWMEEQHVQNGFHGTIKEVVGKTTIYVLKDTDAAYYWWSKYGLEYTLTDTNEYLGTTRLRNFFENMTFFPAR